MVDKKPLPAFLMYEYGDDRQGEERFAKEVGVVLQSDIPALLVELGRKVMDSGLTWKEWVKANPDGIRETAAQWL